MERAQVKVRQESLNYNFYDNTMERKLSVPGIHGDGIMRIHGANLLSVSTIPQTVRNNLSDTQFK